MKLLPQRRRRRRSKQLLLMRLQENMRSNRLQRLLRTRCNKTAKLMVMRQGRAGKLAMRRVQMARQQGTEMRHHLRRLMKQRVQGGQSLATVLKLRTRSRRSSNRKRRKALSQLQQVVQRSRSRLLKSLQQQMWVARESCCSRRVMIMEKQLHLEWGQSLLAMGRRSQQQQQQ
jgi:hypothetical protein